MLLMPVHPTGMSAHICTAAGNRALHVLITDHPAPIGRRVLFELIVDQLRLQINTQCSSAYNRMDRTETAKNQVLHADQSRTEWNKTPIQ
jgi:hypothetical protein